MGDRRFDREAQYWKLTSLLLLTVAALVLFALSLPEYTTGLLIAALPIAVTALLVVRFQRSLMQDMQAELQRQLPVDSDTGAISQFWFQRTLEQECRRALREFTPISVVHLLPADPTQSLHQKSLVDELNQRMTRPGDLVALDTTRGLWLLLPATNEAVSGFAERIFKLVNQLAPNTHLTCYTFQPMADLSPIKVTDVFAQLETELDSEPNAKMRCESEGFDMPSVTYSL